ncbi:MAG: site-specific integrase [Bacteroidaceae bacterium]|nr:site-specific integrase [Bacteroidaceae bacterium]
MIAAVDYNVCLNRNGYVNKNGTRQVVIEIYQCGSRRTLNTHIHVAAQDFAYGRIQPSHPDYDLLNRRIRRIVRRLMELEDEMLNAGYDSTPERILNAYVHNLTRSATVSEWIASVIVPSGRKNGTKELYHSLIHSLEDFHPGLRIREISYDLIERWRNWMRTDRHLADSTISCRMKTLRCIINEAIKRDVLRVDEDPFKHIRIPEIKARHEHLSEQELQSLEQVEISNKHLSHVRDAFLFCCYTGLRWSDFRSLTSANLCGRILILNQQKTDRHLQIPIDTLWGGKAALLISQYGTLEHLADIGSNFDCNHSIRQVAQLAGIQKHLHWHLARHTCGTLLNQRGLRMQEIQYILGHQKQETTEKHYAETLFEQVQSALQKAFG